MMTRTAAYHWLQLQMGLPPEDAHIAKFSEWRCEQVIRLCDHFIYCGILFTAAGILFPLPLAMLVSFLGAVIMVSLPYCLGRWIGGGLIDSIIRKYPKTAFLRQLQMENELFLSFITRAINILPSDILSLYMGASGIHYGKYLLGSIAGMLMTIVTFPIINSSITDPASPLFIASVVIQVVVTVVSITGYAMYLKKKNRAS